MLARRRQASAIASAAAELVLTLLGILFVRREIWTIHILNLSMPNWQEALLLPLAAIDGAVSGAFATSQANIEHRPSYKKLLRVGVPAFYVCYIACAALCLRLSTCVFAQQDFVRTLGVVICIAGVGLRIWSQVCLPAAFAPTTLKIEGESKSQAEDTSIEDKKESAPDQNEPAQAEQNVEGQKQQEQVDAFVGKITESAAQGRGDKKQAADKSYDRRPIVALGPYKILRYPDLSARLLCLCGLPLIFDAWLPLLALPGIFVLLKWHISDRESFRISQLGESYLTYKKESFSLLPFVY